MRLNGITQTTLTDAFLTFFGLCFVPLTFFYRRAFCFGFGKLLGNSKNIHAYIFASNLSTVSLGIPTFLLAHTCLKGLDFFKNLPCSMDHFLLSFLCTCSILNQ